MTRKKSKKINDSRLIVLPPPRTALSKMEHVREELARVYRAARTGAMDTADATRLTYILATLAKIIETSEIETRLDEIEKQLKEEKLCPPIKSNWQE